MKTNYRLKDGDIVQFLVAVKVPEYVFYGDTHPIGDRSWSSGSILPGATGKVARARTPKVTKLKGDGDYFANVDVEMPDGKVVRVRPDHSEIRKVYKGMPQECYMLFCGDAPEAAKFFTSVAWAKEEFLLAARDLARYGQALTASLHFVGYPDEEWQEYPDRILRLGPRGGLVVEMA